MPTSTSQAAEPSRAPYPAAVPSRIMAPNPIRPLRAARAMRALINDPDETSHVFTVIKALSGRSFDRLFARVMADPVGRRILEERRALIPVLSDRERLRAMPAGSLGCRYASFMDAERITADGLQEASLVHRTEFYDERARCLSDRLRDMHDLWHVVTGYGRDLVGEAALLAFSYAQIRNRGVGFIVTMGTLKLWREGYGYVVPVVMNGWRRGRRAAFLVAADWESLLERPLEEVRRELRIDAPPTYAPLPSQASSSSSSPSSQSQAA